MNRKLEETITSDFRNPTMLAIETFDGVLEHVRNSCLNFSMQVSPFSAVISIKKSLIKDKTGQLLLPSPRPATSENIQEMIDKNKKLERDVITLTQLYEDSVNQCENAYEVIKFKELKEQEAEAKVKVENEEHLAKEIKYLRDALNDRDDEIATLKTANKAAKEAIGKLNKTLNECKSKYSEEKATVSKEHRSEVRAWKKDLGEANRNITKLEEKLQVLTNPIKSSDQPSFEKSTFSISTSVSNVSNAGTDSDILCSICADPIPNFKPKYFLGDAFNPACDNCDDSFEGDDSGPDQNGCKHSPVCVLRQPLPPPFPSITHLFNERTKYHEHMMSNAGVPGRYPGHERCMDAYSKNYGCEDCVWLKWHGEIHGYPDIHPSDYKKHLEPKEWEIVRLRM